MKRKDLLLLTFLLSQAVPAGAMDEPTPEQNIPVKTQNKENQDPLQQVKNLQHSLFAIQREIEKFPQDLRDGKKVFLVGVTGSGKSTLMNFLVGKDIAVDDNGNLDTQNPVKGSEIGHGGASKTTSPSFCQGPDNMVFCDLAGLEDSRGAEQELINRYATYKAFSGQCKFLVAVSENSLTDRYGDFIQLLNTLTKTLPLDQLKTSLALVVTKQGFTKRSNPHRKLREITTENSLSEEAKQLLLHLTEQDNIHLRVPFFPCPGDINCPYDSPESREIILKSIETLDFISNPSVQLDLSPASLNLISGLADNLNKEVTTSLDMLRHKVVHLCKHQINAYKSDGHMQDLEINLGAIRKALQLLDNNAAESILDFTHPLDHFFDQDHNIVKDYVKTLMFLKTLKNNIGDSKGAWARTLQLTVDDMHELIDSLASRLFHKVATSLETINESIRCKALPEPDNEERNIGELSNTLDAINTVVATLQADLPGTMVHFTNPLSKFILQSNPNSIESHMGTLEFLKTLKKIDYPIGMWTGPFNTSISHLQGIIDTQKNIIALKEQNQRLEEERVREEATRHAHAAEVARIAAEAEERQRQMELRAEEQRRALEEAARVERAEAAATAERQRLAQEEAERQTQALLQQQIALQQQQLAQQQAQAAAAEQQRKVEAAAAEQREKEAAAERERQRLADLEAQRQEREALAVQLQAVQDQAAADRQTFLDELAAANKMIKTLRAIPVDTPTPQPQQIRTKITRMEYKKAIKQGATNVEAVDAPNITYWRKKDRAITKEQYDTRVKNQKTAYMKPPGGKNYYRVTDK